MPLTGWGRTAPTVADVVGVHDRDDAVRALGEVTSSGAIARGLGRSYGDAAQNAGGVVLDTLELRGITDLDEAQGTVTAAAGTSFDHLMRELLPRGWFVPVTPGTRFVTVGGAVASDIHGKNHHVDGTFCEAVRSVRLVAPTGEEVELTPDGPHADWFWATAGGMGLTGVITSATFELIPVETSHMVVDTDRAVDLDSCMALLEAGDDARYSVAWIDCLARGRHLGRSVVTRGRHARVDELGGRRRRAPRAFDPVERVQAPPVPTSALLNPATVGAFNELWFRKAPKHRQGETQSITAFFHPLDMVGAWNRLYGPAGLVQHQCLLPNGEEAALRQIIELLATSGTASFLAVLKRFGPGNPGPLSFPAAGWTLALDLPAGRRALGPLLDELDRRVLDAGGRIYLAKDSRTRPEMLREMYPRLDEWRAVQRRVDPDRVMQSDLARRLGLLA